MNNRIFWALLIMVSSAFAGGSMDVAGHKFTEVVDAVQANGKRVIVGTEIVNGMPQLIVVRYNPDQKVDTTFGAAGVVNPMLGRNVQARSLKITPNPKVAGQELIVVEAVADAKPVSLQINHTGIVIGSTSQGGVAPMVMPAQRVLPSATISAAVRAQEQKVVFSPNPHAVVGSLRNMMWAKQYDGSTIVSGDVFDAAARKNINVQLRYGADGKLDTNFGDKGVLRK